MMIVFIDLEVCVECALCRACKPHGRTEQKKERVEVYKV
jgi:hypothetical protein